MSLFTDYFATGNVNLGGTGITNNTVLTMPYRGLVTVEIISYANNNISNEFSGHLAVSGIPGSENVTGGVFDNISLIAGRGDNPSSTLLDNNSINPLVVGSAILDTGWQVIDRILSPASGRFLTVRLHVFKLPPNP